VGAEASETIEGASDAAASGGAGGATGSAAEGAAAAGVDLGVGEFVAAAGAAAEIAVPIVVSGGVLYLALKPAFPGDGRRMGYDDKMFPAEATAVYIHEKPKASRPPPEILKAAADNP
jgi:hypothetical protein